MREIFSSEHPFQAGSGNFPENDFSSTFMASSIKNTPGAIPQQPFTKFYQCTFHELTRGFPHDQYLQTFF